MAIHGEILKQNPKVVNIGAQDFAAELIRQDVPVIVYNWRPPLENKEMASLLDDLL